MVLQKSRLVHVHFTVLVVCLLRCSVEACNSLSLAECHFSRTCSWVNGHCTLLSGNCSHRIDPVACLTAPPWPTCAWADSCVKDPSVHTDHDWYMLCEPHNITSCLDHSNCLWHSLWNVCAPNLPILCPEVPSEQCDAFPGCYRSESLECLAEGLLGSLCHGYANQTACHATMDCEWTSGTCLPKMDWSQALDLYCARDYSVAEWTRCQNCESCAQLSPVCRLSADGLCTVSDSYGRCRLVGSCNATPGCATISSTDCWPEVHKFRRDQQVASWAMGFYINSVTLAVLLVVNVVLIYVPSCQGTF